MPRDPQAIRKITWGDQQGHDTEIGHSEPAAQHLLPMKACNFFCALYTPPLPMHPCKTILPPILKGGQGEWFKGV